MRILDTGCTRAAAALLLIFTPTCQSLAFGAQQGNIQRLLGGDVLAANAIKKHGFDIEAAAELVLKLSTPKWKTTNAPGKQVDANFERANVVKMMHFLSEDKWTQPVFSYPLRDSGYKAQFDCLSAAAMSSPHKTLRIVQIGVSHKLIQIYTNTDCAV
jgi:hypothetical protein